MYIPYVVQCYLCPVNASLFISDYVSHCWMCCIIFGDDDELFDSTLFDRLILILCCFARTLTRSV